MKKVSIIIPIYNVEKYLHKCIESVESQTLENIEVILVNDGSTDNSEIIIEKFKEKYNNIKYIKKENGGLSDARNVGIRNATGDYILFVDSDDYISDTLLNDLSIYMEQEYDLIKFKMIKVDENYKEIGKVEGPIFENKNGEEAFNLLYGNDVMLQPAWLYLYKKSFWDRNKFEYPVGMNHEDFARTALIMLKADSVASTNVYGYYYVQSEGSITRGNDETKKLKRAQDIINHYDYMLRVIDDYNIMKRTKDNLKIYYTNCMILKLDELSEESKKVYLKELKERKVFKNIKVRSPKQLIKKILLNINVDWYLKLR